MGKQITDISDFEQGWTRFMIDIWHERQVMLGIRNTGALRSSVSSSITDDGHGHKQISHKFLMYGIYVASGVGGAGDKGLHGYKKGNGGYLEFLAPAYREEHGLNKPRTRGPKWGGGKTSGKPRKARNWFAKKYFYSIMRLNEKEAAYFGEKYRGFLIEAVKTLVGDNETKNAPVKNVLEM